jgi:hypothetical protein
LPTSSTSIALGKNAAMQPTTPRPTFTTALSAARRYASNRFFVEVNPAHA